ncbi:MAG: bifunctional oligoribonuclease/PAP phosphatase NrnA [Bacillales bacterium]|nr:bifunctional oligoribonuclease/PAP phosphatase NrnA [Bacillales bacterium]
MNYYKAIYKKIKANENIIVVSHIRADGDCVGSAIGLREIIKATFPKKNVKALHENASYLSFLGKSDEAEDNEFKDALVISVDNSNIARTNEPRIKDAKEIIKIDHHPNTEPFGSEINFVEEEKCATAEIIFDLYLNFPRASITMKGLEALYTGIVTDSGRFKYPGVDGGTMAKVGIMYDLGLDGISILNKLDEVEESALRFKGFVLLNMERSEGGILYIKIKTADREKYGVSYDDASNMVNAMAGIKDCPIWVLFNENKPDEVRARVRSIGIPINDVCFTFGGGGHENAGGIILKSFDEADEVIKALEEKLKK